MTTVCTDRYVTNMVPRTAPSLHCVSKQQGQRHMPRAGVIQQAGCVGGRGLRWPTWSTAAVSQATQPRLLAPTTAKWTTCSAPHRTQQPQAATRGGHHFPRGRHGKASEGTEQAATEKEHCAATRGGGSRGGVTLAARRWRA
jgi:hypothetical protein